MVKHVVMWKFKPGTEVEAQHFLDGLMGLQSQIEVLRSVEVGMNSNPKETYSAVLICTFDSYADLDSYQNDPRHLAVASICRDIREARSCVDFEF